MNHIIQCVVFFPHSPLWRCYSVCILMKERHFDYKYFCSESSFGIYWLALASSLLHPLQCVLLHLLYKKQNSKSSRVFKKIIFWPCLPATVLSSRSECLFQNPAFHCMVFSPPTISASIFPVSSENNDSLFHNNEIRKNQL